MAMKRAFLRSNGLANPLVSSTNTRRLIAALLRRLRAQEDLRNDRGVAQPADRKFIVMMLGMLEPRQVAWGSEKAITEQWNNHARE
jgi:hypothetical protein